MEQENKMSVTDLHEVCEIEHWEPVFIEGLEHLYHISCKGRVKALARKVTYIDGRVFNYKEHIMKTHIDKEGVDYPLVNMCYGRKVYISKPIHILKMKAFVPNPLNKPCINHKDGNKQNYALSNLEWCTVAENNKHAIENGLAKPLPIRRKLSDEEILKIRELYQTKTAKEICELFNVGLRHIQKIASFECWKNIKAA